MENYKVRVLYTFNDTEKQRLRILNEVFNCTKERCEYLISKKAVELLEIEHITEANYIEKPKKTSKKK